MIEVGEGPATPENSMRLWELAAVMSRMVSAVEAVRVAMAEADSWRWWSPCTPSNL
jgi:hypothetical protein